MVGLQELHWETEEQSTTWTKDFPTLDIYSSLGTSKQKRVTIVVAKQLNATISVKNQDIRGRFLSLNVDIGGCLFRVSCLYSPRTRRERDVFLSTVVEPALPSRRHVLLGDFNTVFDLSLEGTFSPTSAPTRRRVMTKEKVKDFQLQWVARLVELGQAGRRSGKALPFTGWTLPARLLSTTVEFWE